MRPFCILLGLLLFPLTLQANIPGLTPEKNWDLNGYVQYIGTATIPDKSDNYLDHLVYQRFNYEYRFSPHLRFNSSMRNRILWGDTAQTLPNYAELIAADPGYMDLSFNWHESDKRVANSQFDRLYLDWSKDDWQARIGRSRINWAMTTLWSPNDIFNSYSIYDVNYEERAGSDSLLLKRKLGFASSVELIYNPNKNSALNSYATRYLFNQQGWDIQALAGKSHLDYTLGGGFAGDINGAGLRGEITWFKPTQDEWFNGSETLTLHSSLVSSIETDYSFTGQGNWMGRLAYLYISNPQQQNSAIAFLNLPLTARTLSFSNHTFYGDLGFEISPLNRLTFSASYYDDGSYFVGLSDSYSLSNNWSLNGVLQRFAGSKGSLFAATPSLLAFVQVKWSF